MGKALIISLNFNPGHVSHMVASYKQCNELGYDSYYYVNPQFKDYLPKAHNIITSDNRTSDCDLAIFLFPSAYNLKLIYHFKRNGTKIIYIFHEPLSPLRDYKRAGFSYKYLAKLWIINRISQLTVKWSDVVLLPSKKAVSFYEKNPIYTNQNYHYLPLMYDDECREPHDLKSRVYFSYIGTIAADHSFAEYLRFVEWAIKNNELNGLQFLIATKSTFDVPDILKFSKRVTIKQGHPLSNDEINTYYASSYCIWNAYARTTQSGVLAKSFMFATPALVLKKNCNEFAQDGVEIKAIDDNTNVHEIAEAIKEIVQNFEQYSSNCRKRFLSSFYYPIYNDLFKSIIN